jgi:hypothetical protein
MNISSRKEARQAGKTYYFTGLLCKYGHLCERQTSNARCVQCLKEYAVANKDKMRENVRRCEQKNLDKKRLRINQWSKNNPHRKSSNEARRRAAMMRRTPQWLTEEDRWLIEQAYELALLRTQVFGFAWHVDHIVPLQGKKVSGLHVPNNLQVIPGAENARKHCKYEVI